MGNACFSKINCLQWVKHSSVKGAFDFLSKFALLRTFESANHKMFCSDKASDITTWYYLKNPLQPQVSEQLCSNV